MRHSLCISATALLIAAASRGASAQTGAGAAAPARTAAGPPARRPLLLFTEEWKQNRKGDGTHVSSTRDWIVSEFTPADVRWMKLDIARVVTTGNLLEKVDLSKVDEIGFADLMPGSGHGPGGWVDVAQIEVYARAVPRSSASQ